MNAPDIPRPKGHRPYYFDDPAIDQLHSAVLALAGELAVAFDRIDTLEWSGSGSSPWVSCRAPPGA